MSAGAAATEVCPHPSRRAEWGGLVSRCEACGLVATAETPAFEYAADYFVQGGTGYDFDSPFARAFDAERFLRELDQLEAQGLRGSVLDVGCAVGTFLVHAKARGWEVAGVELAEYARGVAAERLGVAIAGSAAELPAGRRYDVVTLHHVLEHVHDPVGFLARDVRPRVGRRLWIEVPNFASLAARSEGPRWKDFRPEQHVHHFEPASLARVVAAAGFTVERVTTLVEPLWSLAAARRTLGWLRVLGAAPRFTKADLPPIEPARAPAWTPPTGLRAGVVGASRVALAPLVAWIERTRRGERLVLEARPATA